MEVPSEHEVDAMGYFDAVKKVYRDSLKPNDIFWNVYVARPMAAPLVLLLSRTKVTPNQVTLMGAVVFMGVIASLILVPDWQGMLPAAAILELAYIFDCADGQLARITKMTSTVGAYLDFLIDEFKALGLVAAFSVRLWLEWERHEWLLVGLVGVCMVAVATSLTTFVRRPEYAGVEVKPGVQHKQEIPKSLVGKIVWALKSVAKWLVHYPSWFVYLALIDILEVVPGSIVFLALYLGVYALYIAQDGLGILLKLGRASYYENQS